MPHLTVDLAFVIHPRYGIVAALDVEHPTLPVDVLRRHGFTYDQVTDLYHPSPTASWDQALQGGQRAMAEFATIGYVADASPEFKQAVQRARPRAQPRATPRRLRPDVAGASVVPWIGLIAEADSPGEISELLQHVVGDDDGALAQLHQVLETAANWCEEQGASDASASLGDAAERLSQLGDDLELVHGDLAKPVSTPRTGRSAVARAATTGSPQAASRTGTTATPEAPAPGTGRAPGSGPGPSRTR
jgi:hypothetical protein